MVAYRRAFVAGGTYFFTVALKNRQATWLIDYVDELRLAFRDCRKKTPFNIDAIVILPDHLHTLWELPQGDSNYPARWRFIKSSFTRSLRKRGVNLIKNRHGEYGVWQRRYWEHVVTDLSDYETHIDYIHHNPVKHGYSESVADWPWSSFHTYVKNGFLAESWGGRSSQQEAIGFGE